MLVILLNAAWAGGSGCPATPAHLAQACGGCPPLLQSLQETGLRIHEDEHRAIARCVGPAVGLEDQPVLAAARACVLGEPRVSEPVSSWLAARLDDLRLTPDPTLAAADRAWAQCAAAIRHLDGRPDRCVDPEAVTLREARRRGRSTVALRLRFDNACVRPLTCAVTVSATRAAPARDGVTTVEQVPLPPSEVSETAVRLRFPNAVRSELADWALSDVTCRYDDNLAADPALVTYAVP